MQQDRRLVGGLQPLRKHDIASPAEGRCGPRRPHQHDTARQPFAAPAADQPDHATQRPERMQPRGDRSRAEQHGNHRLPRERRGRCRGRRCRVDNLRQLGHRWDFAVARNDAEGQQHGKGCSGKQHQPVEPVEGRAAQHDPVEDPEDRQADGRFQQIGQKGLHGYFAFFVSMRAISSRSSSTEIFSSSTSAETAPI